jgi:hypothetical protein
VCVCVLISVGADTPRSEHACCDSYAQAAADGFVLASSASPSPPGAVPLWTYWSDAFNDSMQVASPTGLAFVQANNYTKCAPACLTD